jgi:hypothetical protein
MDNFREFPTYEYESVYADSDISPVAFGSMEALELQPQKRLRFVSYNPDGSELVRSEFSVLVKRWRKETIFLLLRQCVLMKLINALLVWGAQFCRSYLPS